MRQHAYTPRYHGGLGHREGRFGDGCYMCGGSPLSHGKVGRRAKVLLAIIIALIFVAYSVALVSRILLARQ